MRINFKFLFLAVFCMIFLGKVFAEDDFNQKLENARKLVEQKMYKEALDIYSAVEPDLRKDPGLLIEWARVYTYADMHKEAVTLFEDIRIKHPERLSEISRELADQYRWSGQPEKSIPIYRKSLEATADDERIYLGLAQALFWNNEKEEAIKVYDETFRHWPDNIDALLGKAEILSYDDKLEEAFDIYQKVLDKNPENLTALNAQAKLMVWKGYHRKGIKRYQAILEKYPKDPDALEGLAFAYHWEGQNLLALERTEELFKLAPDRKEAKSLYSNIKNSQYPFVRPYARFSNDSTPQTILGRGLRSGMHLDYTLHIDGIYENQTLRKKGSNTPTISDNRAGLGISKSFGDTFEFNTYLYETFFSKVDFNPFTTNTWFTYKPDDCWRFDLAYDRETFDDNDALYYKVITNSPSLSVDFRPDRFWFFNVRYERSFFSDDNVQNQYSAKAEYRLNQKPYVKLYYNYYYSDWAEPELGHGYFNPRKLLSNSLGLYTGFDLTRRIFIETQGSGGYEFQRKPDNAHKESNHPTCYFSSSVNYRLANNWLLSAWGDYFTTWPDHGQRSYQKRGAYLSLTYNFGASDEVVREGTRPYRVTGGN